MGENKECLGCGQATREDICNGLRKHYDDLASKGMHWSSGIGHAIDAYEREPLLLEVAKAAAGLGLSPNGSKWGRPDYICMVTNDKAKELYDALSRAAAAGIDLGGDK